MITLSSLESVVHGNAGAIASIIATAMLYPLENLKTRMQVVHNDDENPQELKGFRQTVKDVLAQEGIVGLYKGITPLLIGNYLSYGVYFFWYEYFKQYFKIDPDRIFQVIKPSFLAATLTTVVTNPFWVIQSKMTFSKDQKGFFQKSIQMIQQEGTQSLFKGLQASLILVINPIIQFILYEIFKKRFQYMPYQSFVYFFGGAISKAVATFITYPYQVLRTYAHLEKNKHGYHKLITQIVNNMGLSGLYRGFIPKLSQTVLNSAFMLLFYEKIYEVIKSFLIMFIIMLAKNKRLFKLVKKLTA